MRAFAFRPLARACAFLAIVSAFGCTSRGVGPGQSEDLGEFPAIGKGDAPVVEHVSFVVPPAEGEDPGRSKTWTFRTCGRLAVTTDQDDTRSWERLQLVTWQGERRRRSWRGRSPFLTLEADSAGGECVEYELHVLNWGAQRAYGTLRVETHPSPEPGIEVVFNEPDCDGDGCGGGEPGACERHALLEWLNDPFTDLEALQDAGVHTCAARNLIEYRDGPDGEPGTTDDRRIDDPDDVRCVGEAALDQLHAAVAHACGGAGDLRFSVLDLIQSAQHTIDMAVYGVKDAPVVEALCNAVDRGLRIRVIADDVSEDPDNSRGYYEALFGPKGLQACGAEVDVVRSYGTMHHKFLLVDQGTPRAALLTGSTNLTTAGFEQNHNHAVIVRGLPELMEAYRAELDQFLRHCATDRLEPSDRCTECTPACTEDVGPEGPWPLGDAQVRALFSPADEPLRLLRGQARTERVEQPDPHCTDPDANCVCRTSGSGWACSYCAQGEDGWGLVGRAEDRILMTMYSATDSCFALGLARAAHSGVEVVTVWDYVRSQSPWERDDFLCAEGVPTYISNWGGGSPQVRNHNKTVVVDDTVFDGSMNLSASGAKKNNENTLVIESPRVAEIFAGYIRDEVSLLEASGVRPREPQACRCSDLVDNDGDGLADEDDPDCDAGS